MLNGFSCIVLAAGRSSRTSVPKGLQQVGGSSWIERQVKELQKYRFAKTILVLGFHAETYRTALDGHTFCTIVENAKPELGPFSSLITGITALGTFSGRTFVLPLDVPCPKTDVWKALAEPPESVVLPQFGGRTGHPVLLSKKFLDSLLLVDFSHPDARLDRQIRQLSALEKRHIAVSDPDVLLNLNTDADFRMLAYRNNLLCAF